MQSNPFTKILDHRYKMSVSVRSLLLFITTIILCVYATWEIYWYQKVGLAMVKWHTHIMLYVYAWFLGYIFFSVARFKKEKFQQIILSVWFGFFLMEMLLLSIGEYNTYSEDSGQGYQSPYRASSSYYHTGKVELKINRPEFSYAYPLNSLGFPDREWNLKQKGDTTRRILALGDSFTHGDGDAYGGSYVFRMGKMLNRNDNMDFPYYMMNGGFCGSDPFFNFVNLRDRLVTYSPDVVIQMISSHDMLDDFAARGGMERFLPDGEIKYRKAPWWEPLWAVSNILRAVGSFGVGEPLLEISKQETEAELLSLFTEYVKFCKEKNIVLLLVIRPEKHEWKNNKYDFDFTSLENYLAQQRNVFVFDLLPYNTKYNSVNKIAINDYFWEKDNHHNSLGYQMMGEGIYSALKPILDSIPKMGK